MMSEEMSHDETTQEDLDAYFEKYYPEESAYDGTTGATDATDDTDASGDDMMASDTMMTDDTMTSPEEPSTHGHSYDSGKDSDTDIADIHDHFATKYPKKFKKAVEAGSDSTLKDPSSHGHGHVYDISDDSDDSEDSDEEMSSQPISSEDKDSDTDIEDLHDYFAAEYPDKFAHAVGDDSDENEDDMSSQGMTSEEMSHETT